MPIFIVETAATSPIREYWRVEAATAEEAAETYGEKGECLYDEVLGEEEGRQVSEVHAEAALASFFAAEAARKEAPAMLAALRAVVALAELHIAERSKTPEEESEFLSCAYLVNARALLARIDGTPTAQPAAPTASAAEPTAICCTSCGSTSVCKDAAARWDGSDWELSSTYDDSTCDACGYEGSGFEEVPLSELRAWREDQGFDADALEKEEEL